MKLSKKYMDFWISFPMMKNNEIFDELSLISDKTH